MSAPSSLPTPGGFLQVDLGAVLDSFPLWSLGATSNDVGRYVPSRPRRHQPHRPHQHRPAPHRMRPGPLPPSPVPSAASSRLTLLGPSFQLPNFPSVNRTRRWRQAWWAPKTLAPWSWWAGQGSCEHGSWDLGHGTCCVLRSLSSLHFIHMLWRSPAASIETSSALVHCSCTCSPNRSSFTFPFFFYLDILSLFPFGLSSCSPSPLSL